MLAWCSLPIGNTFMWWLIRAFILYMFIKLSPKQYKIIPVRIFLIMLVANAIYGGVYFVENYWDWKLLVNNLLIFSLPLACYPYSMPNVLTKTMRVWLRYAWIILLILYPFLSSDAFGRFLVPFSFLALFIPTLNKKFLVFVAIAYLITIILGSASRSDMLKFSVTILLGLYCFFVKNRFYYSKLLKSISITLFIAPFVLFYLGATGSFNVFNIDEELELDGKYMISSGDDEEDINALTDTRTFLYEEEINSALNNNYVWFGHSIARGYESVAFGEWTDRAMGLKRGERQSCETSILNVFNYFGVIGVFVYLLVFLSAAYYALFKSNNAYIPIVGTYVSFRWLFAWIEDFSKFDLNYLFLWIMIGMCFSPMFRNMDNREFKSWIKSII